MYDGGLNRSGGFVHAIGGGGEYPMRIALLSLALALLATATAAEPNTLAQVVFSRDGNIVVLDMRHGMERALTTDGAPPGPGAKTYGCPVFVDRDIALFLSWEYDDHGDVSACRLHAGVASDEPQVATWEDLIQPLGLGALPHDQIAFLELDGDEEREDPFGAELHVSIINAEGHVLPTDIATWYGDINLDRARLRVATEGDLLTLPRFPTDVSSWYRLWDLVEDAEIELIPEDLLGGVLVTGVDLTEFGVYGTLLALGEGVGMESGIYWLDLADQQHELLAAIPNAAGLSIDEDEGIAVVGTTDGKLHVVDLESGTVTYLTDGADPDMLPAAEPEPAADEG